MGAVVIKWPWLLLYSFNRSLSFGADDQLSPEVDLADGSSSGSHSTCYKELDDITEKYSDSLAVAYTLFPQIGDFTGYIYRENAVI